MDQNKKPNVDDGQGRGSAPFAAPREADIPILKEKRSEQKGGAVLTPGQGAASVGKRGFWARLMGGAPRGATGGIEIAAKGAASKSAVAGGLKAFLASKAGMAALSLGLSGAGLTGYGFLQKARVGQEAAKEGLELGAISSTISAKKRDAEGSRSLSYAQKMSQGEIVWEAGKNAPAAAPKEKTETADAPAADSDAQSEEMMRKMTAQGEDKQRMGGDIGKLSSQLGGSSAFGSKNIFGGQSNFQAKGMQSINTAKDLNSRSKNAARGSLSARRPTNARLAKSMSTRQGISSGKSMRQLRFANRMSRTGAASGTGAAQADYAAAAFEQQTAGQRGGAIGADSPDSAPGGGPGGAPSGTPSLNQPACGADEERTPDGFCLPRTGPGQNVGGQFIDKAIEGFRKQMDQADRMIKIGIGLIVLGIALIVAGGIWDMGTLKVIGALMIVMGGVMIAMGHSQKKQAKEQLEKTLKEKQKQEDLYRATVEDDERRREEMRQRLQQDRVQEEPDPEPLADPSPSAQPVDDTYADE